MFLWFLSSVSFTHVGGHHCSSIHSAEWWESRSAHRTDPVQNLQLLCSWTVSTSKMWHFYWGPVKSSASLQDRNEFFFFLSFAIFLIFPPTFCDPHSNHNFETYQLTLMLSFWLFFFVLNLCSFSLLLSVPQSASCWRKRTSAQIRKGSRIKSTEECLKKQDVRISRRLEL